MSGEPRAVLAAIDRWVRAGLIEPETASRLREETRDEAGRFSKSLTQYVLASTGGIVLVIAAGVFIEWSWPLMTVGMRASTLLVIGLGVIALGARLEKTPRWAPASYLLQAGGLGVVLAAMIYSTDAWDNGTLGAIVFGAICLAAPVVVGVRGTRTNVVTPAVGFAFGLASFAVFVMRALSLTGDDVIWATDAVFLFAIIGLLRTMARDPHGQRSPWALYTFITGLFAGFLIVLATAGAALEMGDNTFFALDVWLFTVVALTLWGMHRGPDHVMEAGLERILVVLMMIWVGLGFGTALEALDAAPEVALLFVSGAGVAGFGYADRHALREVMGVSALAFIVGLWYWGVERGGALGAALALFATAGVLFWMSGRSSGGVDAAASAERAG